MGSTLEIGIKMRKLLVISTRACYGSVCNHPFLVGFLGLLFLLYRSFPFLFSILVSASPILICTAILLGTLLSFGQPNVPEIEKEEKITDGVSSLQTEISEGDTVLKGYSENRSFKEERGIEEEILAGEKDDKVEEDGDLLSDVPLDDDNDSIHLKKQVNEEVEREFCSFELGKKREVREENLRPEGVSSDEEAIEKQYVMVLKENDYIVNTDNEKVPADSFDTFKGDHMDFSASSSWKQVDSKDEEEESLESGSDQAESSSPDVSLADIIPMLDELHPLLDVDAPWPVHLYRDGSCAASEKSEKSDDDSVESDEDAETENRGEGEEDGVDEHDDEEEEETEGVKEDESKSAITWTEDDQKNLMDLGSLELERNQRLENLIARRRERRMMTEKNLIDLESSDLPSNVAPISTRRRNPFDFPDESNADMGLPSIPGSAPSILQPRRNPFDIPYDSNEEKPDLKGDSFQQEFTIFDQRDAFFRRHESFSLGPSVLGLSKHESHDIHWKPVFVSERMASEGTSYSQFQRQSSEVSDSKLSSVPDTESVSSVDQDERKLSEQDLYQEIESNIDHVAECVEHGSQSSGEIESLEINEVEESNFHHDEVKIVLGGVENPSEMELYHETGEVEIHEQLNAGERHLRREPIDEESSSRLSQSSLSEVIDNISDKKMEKSANMQQGDAHLQKSRIPTQASVEELNFQDASGKMEDNHHIEPVYDSSPPAAGMLQSFSSESSDSAMELSERTLPLASIERTANVVDKESQVHDQRLKENTSVHEEVKAISSRMEIKNELRTENSKDTNEHNDTSVELSAIAPKFVDQNGTAVSESLVLPVSVDSRLPSDIGTANDVTSSGFAHGQGLANHLNANYEILLQDNVESPSSNYQMASENLHSSDDEFVEEGVVHNEVSGSNIANMSEAVQDAEGILDLVDSDVHIMSSNDASTLEARDLLPSLVAGQASGVHPTLLAEETEHMEKKSSNKEGIFQVKRDEFSSSSSVDQGNNDIYQDLDENVASSSLDSQYEVDGKSTSNFENNLSSSENSVVASSSRDHDEIQVESTQGVGTSNDGVGELHDDMDRFTPNISAVISDSSNTPEFSSPTGEVDLKVYGNGTVENEDQNEALEPSDHSEESYMSQITEENIKELDEMKEIDEALLSELDSIGDFSISDAGKSLHADLMHEKTGDAQISSLPTDVKVAEVEQDISVLEARSLEDMNLAFKKLQEEVGVKEVILSITTNDQIGREESKEQGVDSDFEFVEGNQGDLPKSLDLKDGSVKVEANEVGLAKAVESSGVANGIVEMSGSSGTEVEANDVGSAKVVEFSAVANSAEEMSGTKLENVHMSSANNEVGANEVTSVKVVEFSDVANSTEEMSGNKLENVHISSSSNEAKSHSRKSSSSSSSSSSDSD